MLLFYGKEESVTVDGKVYDENVSRAARLKALRSHFYAWKRWAEFAPDKTDSQSHAFNMAKEQGISRLKGDKSILVLNAHGSPSKFAGLSGEKIAQDLLAAGLREAGTKEIWVAACNVAKQEQDNAQPPDNVIKQILFTLQSSIPGIKVYGSRGYVSYTDKSTVSLPGGLTTLAYAKVYIRLKNPDGSIKERYDFDKGWLLAKFP